MRRTPFDLIIFDCDGVLVDSERLSNTIFADMLREIGLDFTLEEMFERFVGRTMSACEMEIARLRGAPVPDGFIARVHQRTREAFRASLEAVEGVEALVRALPVPYCVASSGDYEKIRTSLACTGLLPLFEGRLVSATDVAHGKPHPDVFLLAAQRFATSPDRCAVIEDSPAGVQAGVAAGMTVFGFAKEISAQRLFDAGAHLVFTAMPALAPILGATTLVRNDVRNP